MDLKQAGASLDSMISSFNARIAELQELVIARNMYPANNILKLTRLSEQWSSRCNLSRIDYVKKLRRFLKLKNW
ncbi:hypothetical protein ACHQM5_010360 [Ranunculus cassubicifolius]